MSAGGGVKQTKTLIIVAFRDSLTVGYQPHISFTPPFLTRTMDRIEMGKVFSFAEKWGRGLWAIDPG